MHGVLIAHRAIAPVRYMVVIVTSRVKIGSISTPLLDYCFFIKIIILIRYCISYLAKFQCYTGMIPVKDSSCDTKRDKIFALYICIFMLLLLLLALCLTEFGLD